jgi:HK97 family phage prohead protease
MTVNRAERLQGVTERRSIGLTDFETRADGSTLQFSGYASLFGVGYEMYGGPDKGGWIEYVDSKAFDRTLSTSPDVVLNMNHGEGGTGLPIARTSSKTLQLRTDKKGLLSSAELDLRDPDVQALQVKVERGDVNQMSFAFRTIRQEWDDEETKRTLLELSLDRGDVSIVTNGANPNTSVQIRGLDDAISYLAQFDVDEALAETRSLDDESLKHLAEARELLDRLLTRTDAEVPASEQGHGMSLKTARRMALLDA